MTPTELTFQVFYKDRLLGIAKTDERFELIRAKLTEEELADMKAGDIVFNVISYT